MTALPETASSKGEARKVEKNQRGAKARKWWEDLQPPKEAGRKSGSNRAALAKLRRCSSWIEAAAQPETALLFNSLGGGSEARFQRVAVLASVLAHVRSDENRKVAEACGPKAGDEATAILSTLRLRRLLTTTGDDAILTAFRRLVALMNDTANVADLAKLILNWDSEWSGEETRMQFAFEYWQAGAAAPKDRSGTSDDMAEAAVA